MLSLVPPAGPAAFDLKDDTFTFDWQPGTTQRVTLKPLRNDAGGVGLTIVGLKNINGMVGTVLVPSTNPRVIIYRWGCGGGSWLN
jgi:hypothetical protein